MVDWKNLSKMICGFRLFIGDVVLIDETEYFVTSIDLEKRKITLTRLVLSEITRILNVDTDLEIVNKTGRRIEVDHCSLAQLKFIYAKLSSSAKAFYLYHYYNCDRSKIKYICKRLELSKEELKSTLEIYNKKGYFKGNSLQVINV